jgi:hypothetical protein
MWLLIREPATQAIALITALSMHHSLKASSWTATRTVPDKTQNFCEKFAKASKAASFKHRRLNRAFALERHGGASAQGLQLKLSALSRSTREGNFPPSRRLKLTQVSLRQRRRIYADVNFLLAGVVKCLIHPEN